MVNGEVPGPIGNRHPSITPFEGFTASDGYVIVGAGNDRLWKKLCDLLGKPELVNDERFATNGDRTHNQKALKVILDGVFKNKTIDEWLVMLEEAGIPCAPINTVDRVLKDPQIKARDMIVEVEHPVAGKMHLPGVPIKMYKTPGSVDKAAPLLGQHTEEILQEILGYDTAKVQELRDQGVL